MAGKHFWTHLDQRRGGKVYNQKILEGVLFGRIGGKPKPKKVDHGKIFISKSSVWQENIA